MFGSIRSIQRAIEATNYTSDFDYFGSEIISISVSDEAATVTHSIDLTVLNANDAPRITFFEEQYYEIYEDTSVSFDFIFYDVDDTLQG